MLSSLGSDLSILLVTAGTEDLVKWVVDAFRLDVPEVEELCSFFWKGGDQCKFDDLEVSDEGIVISVENQDKWRTLRKNRKVR